MNIINAQLPRLRNQPEFVTTYQRGDLVLRDPQKETGALPLRDDKLAPALRGPYELIAQMESTDGTSNSVRVLEVNDKSKAWTFHHPTPHSAYSLAH